MSVPDDSAMDQFHQMLVALAESLGVNSDAPDVVAQFAAALLLAILPILNHRQSRSPAKSRRTPTWRAGLYEELNRDVNETKARLNCSIRGAIAHLRKDKGRQWWKYKPQTLEQRYHDSRDWMRDRIARVLVSEPRELGVASIPSRTD